MNKKNLKKILIGLLIFYVAVVATVFALQKYIIFQSVKLDRDFEFLFENPHEEFFLKTSDGAELNVLLFKTKQKRKGLVIYFHGNADNLVRWGKLHEDFISRGYDFVISDYRGYGKSTGKSDEQLFYQDAKFIYDWVLEKYSKEEIIIFGRSLGCAMASNLATKVEAKQVILETPFFDMNDVFRCHATRILVPFDLKHNFPNNEHLQKISEPVFIFAGTKDKVVPNRSTKKLKPFLKPSDQYIVIEGARHKDLRNFPKYNQALDKILQ